MRILFSSASNVIVELRTFPVVSSCPYIFYGDLARKHVLLLLGPQRATVSPSSGDDPPLWVHVSADLPLDFAVMQPVVRAKDLLDHLEKLRSILVSASRQNDLKSVPDRSPSPSHEYTKELIRCVATQLR